jgi:hypothetical protein
MRVNGLATRVNWTGLLSEGLQVAIIDQLPFWSYTAPLQQGDCIILLSIIVNPLLILTS